MQIYHFPSRSTYLERAQDVKSYFDSYVTGYFTSIEVNQGSNYADVDFFVSGRDTKAMTIRIANDYPKLIIGGTEIYIGKSGYLLSSLVVTDNAVFVVGYVSGTYPVFCICKSTEGGVLAAYFWSSSYGTKGIGYGSNNDIRVFSLADGSLTYYKQYAESRSTGRTVGVSLISGNAGTSKDVYIPYVASFTSITDPLKYQIGGVNYVSIGGGTFIVKSE